MSEDQAEYVTEQEVNEALEMLGKGYESSIEIHRPSRVIAGTSEGLKEYRTGVWIKLSTSFRKTIGELKGSRLAVFLDICLHIDENNNCYPSLETIANETGYSKREVINAVQELEGIGYLTVRRGEKRFNLYHVNVAVAMGAENAPVHFSAGNGELSAKNMSQSSLKEEPIKKRIKKDAVDFEIDFHLKPGGIRNAIAQHFKLTPNWEAKYNRQFLEWTIEAGMTVEQIERAANVWRMDRRFNWTVPTLKGIQEHWQELIYLPEVEQPRHAPIPERVRTPRPAHVPPPRIGGQHD